jgi:hypothetical protein
MKAEVIEFKEPRSFISLVTKLPPVFLQNENGHERFFGFFTANIRNKNTRRAYYKAACGFCDWCESRGLDELAGVKPPQVAAYTRALLAVIDTGSPTGLRDRALIG